MVVLKMSSVQPLPLHDDTFSRLYGGAKDVIGAAAPLQRRPGRVRSGSRAIHSKECVAHVLQRRPGRLRLAFISLAFSSLAAAGEGAGAGGGACSWLAGRCEGPLWCISSPMARCSPPARARRLTPVS
jgi:hypothetical protein